MNYEFYRTGKSATESNGKQAEIPRLVALKWKYNIII